MDIEQLYKGYTKEDEFIARDCLILELLVEKGIITLEEVDEMFKKVPNKIQEVKKIREDMIKNEYNKLMGKENEKN